MNVVIKSALASMVLLAGSASVVHAAGAGAGTVTFKGSIIEAACSIDPRHTQNQEFARQEPQPHCLDWGAPLTRERTTLNTGQGDKSLPILRVLSH